MKTYESTVGKLGLPNIGQPVKVEKDGNTYYGAIKSFTETQRGHYIYVEDHIIGPLEDDHEILLLAI